MIKVTKTITVEYVLDLDRYSEAELKKMYLQHIITKQEMNDEIDARNERIVTPKDRVS